MCISVCVCVYLCVCVYVSICVYMRMCMRFGSLFYSISTILGHLTPNPFYTCIRYMISFQTIQFSLCTQFKWPIGRTKSGSTTPVKNGLGSNGNEGVLRIPQSSSITGVSPSDFLCHIQDSHWGRITPLRRCSRCILQPQPMGWMLSCHIQDTRWGSLTSLQRCSRCILPPKPTGHYICVRVCVKLYI